MTKKILLAVDNSRPSKSAIDYVVQMSSTVPELNYVLFHVQPMVSLFLEEEARKSSLAKKQLKKVRNRNNQFAHQLLNGYRHDMEAKGIPSDRIETVTLPRKLGYAKDVLDYAIQASYDAIVVGRRGLSGIAKMYAGSVTANILEHSQIIPVWLIDGKVAGKEILVAVDGSEASLRAIDHISFFLSGNSESRLTILHVAGTAQNYCEIDLEEEPDPDLEKMVVRGDKACIDQFYSHAMQKFNQAGIGEDRIRLETVQGRRNVGKAIVDFSQKENYGTIVIGRRGIDKSFFIGSVSRYIINNFSDRALWIVP
jgi:nucleotide-binding universal stress UspA family protein